MLQDKEVHILLDDQQKINKFARLNSRLEELKEDIKNKKNEIQTLEDATTDIMMMEDDEEKVKSCASRMLIYFLSFAPFFIRFIHIIDELPRIPCIVYVLALLISCKELRKEVYSRPKSPSVIQAIYAQPIFQETEQNECKDEFI
jgi:hypothetical protein